jgi:N-methylhydantoinase B
MAKTILKIPGSDHFFSDGKRPDLSSISPKLKVFSYDDKHKVDPITFEVVAHKLWQINDEQGQTLKKISGSPVATDANDFNVVLCDELGDIINIGPYYLPHASNVDFMVKWTVVNRSDNPGINPDDMFLCNDPWIGALHPQDVAVLSPIFVGDELFAWTGSTIHEVDLGGVNVGSWCVDADDHFSEGMAYPPIKIVEAGSIRKDVEDVYLRRSRAPALVGLDLRAHIASNNVAKQRILELIERYGAKTINVVMKRQMDYAEQRFRDRLRQIPDGTWRCETYQEVARSGDRGVYKTVLAMTKRDDTLEFDFSGSDPNVGMINCTRAGAVGGSTVAILPLLCFDIPWALGGIHRALNFITPLGTIINAEFPHGVSMGSIAGTWSATNAANNCVSRMLTSAPELQDRLLAGCVGSWTTVIASGLDNNKLPFVTMIMDCMAGGWGARSFADGVDTAGLMAAITGQCPNVETNEGFYPILYLYRRETKDSGGPGEFRGGMGATSCWIPHDTEGRSIQLVLATFGQAFPTAFGVDGGYPANSSMFKMVRRAGVDSWFARGEIPTDLSSLGGNVEYMTVKCETVENPDDVFEHTWSGGGGYGDPLDRRSEKVLADILNDAVSYEVAEKVYGVILKDGAVDTAATEQRRRQIRGERIGAKAINLREKRDHNIGGGRQISRHLVLNEDNNVQCAGCGHVHGSALKNYKLLLVRKDNDIREANPLLVDPKIFIDPDVQFRQYFCPSCATQVETEVILAGSEPVWDKQLRIEQSRA